MSEKKMKRKERKQALRENREHQLALRNEMDKLERVVELSEDLYFDYEKPTDKSTLSDIRYHALYEDGLCEVCENVYSFTASFSNITYQIAGQEEQMRIFTKYCELLNYLPHTVNAQLSIRNYYRDNEEFFRSIKMPYSREYDKYAKELNAMIKTKAIQGDNSLVAANYLTISFAAGGFKEAHTISASIKSDLRKYFKGLKCDYKFLSGVERVRLLHSYFHSHYFNFEYKQLLESGLTTKSYIAPEQFDFSPNNHFEFFSKDLGKQYGQTLVLKNLPPNMSDDLIANMTDTKCPMTFNMFLRPIRQETAVNMIKNQRASMDMEGTRIQEKNIQRIFHPGQLPFELTNKISNADEMIKDMERRNQKLFRTTIMVYTSADSPEELKENILKLKAAARKSSCDFAELPEQQEGAINSILPLGTCYIDIERNLTTVNTGIFVPFTTQEIQEDHGLYYRQNAISNNLLMIDRSAMKNGNGIIVGVSGGGKSFKAKEEIAQVLIKYPNDHIMIIDPENEVSPLAELMPGEVIEISAGSKTHINPLDMTVGYGDDESPLLLKGEFILSVCETVLGELTPIAKSLLDKAMRITYEPFFKSNLDPKKTPTLKELNNILKKQPEAEAQDIASALELYTDGSLSAFAHRTNVDTKSRFTIFNTFKLGSQLKALGLIIVIDHIWNTVIENHKKGIRTWVYVDEMQVFFDTENSSNYFANIWARFRKRGAYATGMTQNVERILHNKTARFILSNSELVIMLDQGKPDREALTDIFDISEEQQEYITNAEIGHGLIRVGKVIIPFVDEFPEDTELYKAMSTKPSDMLQYAL